MLCASAAIALLFIAQTPSVPSSLSASRPFQSITSSETRAISAANKQSDARRNPASAEPRLSQSRLSQYLESGEALYEQGEYAAAAQAYQRAIALIEDQTRFDPLLKAEALFGLGSAYRYLDDYDLAIAPLEQSLSLVESLDENYQSTQDLSAARYADLLIALFRELGVVHHERSELGESLLYYRRGLVEPESPVFRTEIQAILLHNIGIVEEELGDDRAQETLESAAKLSREAERFDVEASAIFNLGWVAENAGDNETAIARYQQAIGLFQTTNTPERLVRAYGNLAQVHINQQDYASAEAVLRSAYDLLNIQSDPDPLEYTHLLNRSGQLAQTATDRETAWQNYRLALSLSQEIDDFGPIQALFNLGMLLEKQEQPDLAIFFYKQAITRIETTRQNIQKLSVGLQRSHTQTIEGEYRHLADLLLQQNRKTEALQILELLKIQEVATYLNSNQAEQTAPELNLFTPAEEDIQQYFDSLSENSTLADFIQTTLQTAQGVESASSPFDSQVIDDLRSAIAQQPTTTAVLYPVILPDRLEILLINPNGHIEQFSTAVSQADISTTISELQAALKDNILSPKLPAQQLYAWLIEPLESSLEEQQVKNIIYLPDSVLRYVPLAAFHDGDRWLAESYQSHNITAATVGDLLTNRPNNMSILAGAFADTSLTHEVSIGDISRTYSGLKAARQELENLSEVADTQTFFDRDFTPEDTLSAVLDHSVLHLATHAQFVVGQPEESFILFGSGQTVNLKELRQWQLPNVELVVLSACQTATSTEGEGKEILGLGYQIQQTGASAAIASLWAVDDTATAALMNQFYIALSQGQTKAQALRSAQQRLIEDDAFSHPYHWSGFILIGNGQ